MLNPIHSLPRYPGSKESCNELAVYMTLCLVEDRAYSPGDYSPSRQKMTLTQPTLTETQTPTTTIAGESLLHSFTYQ